MRVLLVEDEPDLANALARALSDEAFAVDVADGDEGLFRATEIAYDAVILDMMLPARNGWDAAAAGDGPGHAGAHPHGT